MMYIGTSLGRCLRSILLGEVSYDQVFLISTGTLSTTKEQYLDVVKQYYHLDQRNQKYLRNQKYHLDLRSQRNMHSDYDLKPWSWETVNELAIELWDNGKIHQPRNFGGRPIFPTGFDLWFEIIPPQILEEPAAKDLWEKLKVIARLCE